MTLPYSISVGYVLCSGDIFYRHYFTKHTIAGIYLRAVDNYFVGKVMLLYSPRNGYELNKVGREIKGSTYEDLKSQLMPSESLFAWIDNSTYKQGPHIPNEDVYNQFAEQCKQGKILSMRFFGVPKNYINLWKI